MVIELFNNVLPPTFKVPIIDVSFDNVAIPDTFNDDIIVDIPFNFEVPDTFKLFAFNIVADENESKLVNNDVLVLCKFDMFKFEYVDNEFKLPIKEVLVNAPFIRLLYTENPEILISDKHVVLL